MPVRTLLPGSRSGPSPWLIWTQWHTAGTCISDSDASHYPGGVLPPTAWVVDGGSTLLECVQTAGDSKAAKITPAGAVSNTRYLLTEFPADADLSGATLRSIRFRVNRRKASGLPLPYPGFADAHAYLTKAGVPLTAVDKAIYGSWHVGDDYETVNYVFTAANLATLGVTAADLSGGTIGLAISIQAVAAVTGYIDRVDMMTAYSPADEDDVDYCELPGSLSQPTDWLRIYDWTPAVPNSDVILGIEVDVTAWTDDPNAAPLEPSTVLQDPNETPPAGGLWYYAMEVALSLDGSTPVGESWYIYTTTGAEQFTLGGPGYLWERSGTWWPDDFAGAFSVLVRRPITQNAVYSQYVTAARVRLTTTSNEGSLVMGVRQELTEIVLLGVESVAPGTIATSFQRMRALNYKSRPNFNVKKHRPTGEKMNDVVIPTREWSTGSISGLLDYNELPFALEAIIGRGVHSGAGVVDERNVHTYTLDNRVRSVYRTYSMQRGEKGSRAHQNLYLVHSGLQLQINTQDCQVSGSFFAQKMTDGITLATGTNEVQSMTITGTPTGGTYKLAFKGAETTALAYNADAAAIQTALRALSTINGAHVTVTGTGPYTITFTGDLAGENQPLLVLVNNSLTGGSTPTVTITQTTRGGYTESQLVPVLPGHWNIHLADTQAGLTAGKLDKTVGVAATGIDIGDRHTPFYTLDRDTGGTFTDTCEMDPKFTANLTVGANATGMGLLTDLRNGARKWLRLEAVGPVIGVTADTHKMTWEGPVKVADGADFGNEDGRVIYPWPLEWCEGPNGEVPILTVENGVVSY